MGNLRDSMVDKAHLQSTEKLLKLEKIKNEHLEEKLSVLKNQIAHYEQRLREIEE